MPSLASVCRAFALVAVLWFGTARAGAAPASLDDTARFLAGMKPSAGSPLEDLAGSDSWKRHAAHFDRSWTNLDQRQLSRIRAWTAANLKDPSPVMFYMFSGPDFLYADAFYPNASTYVLAGLEPVGRVPDLTVIQRGSLDRDLRELQVSLNSVLNLSFFITKNMKHELASGRLTGTLPVLYVFLARAGKTVTDVSFIMLDKDGNVQLDDDKPGGGRTGGPPKGVKIGFKGADGRAQTLYYFSTNVADDGFDASGFGKFCAGLGTGDSFLKSASYLMHESYFSKVRQFLLDHSKVLVQDDSGIPVKHFERRSWKLSPHGRYLGPIGTFPGKHQPALGAMFRAATPIDFGIGYRWRPRESNLLLAVKGDFPLAEEAPAAAEPAVAPPPRKRKRIITAVPQGPKTAQTYVKPRKAVASAKPANSYKPAKKKPSGNLFPFP